MKKTSCILRLLVLNGAPLGRVPIGGGWKEKYFSEKETT
jgi:hypothetical protein